MRVQPWLGHRKMESITAGDVEQAMHQWSGGASTKIDALSVLSRLLDGAVRAGVIPLNVSRLARRPMAEKIENPRSLALAPSEVQQLLAAIDSPHHRAYIAALVYTGMRANEAVALQVGDVDLADRTIRVHRSITQGLDGVPTELSPKSHKERDVPIPHALVPHLTLALEGKSRSALVFTGPKGGRLNGSKVRRAVDWNRVRASLDRDDLRLHDLRHTLATLLFDGGAAANDVQAIMGHSSLQTTQRYTRARGDAARRAASTLDGLFEQN
jgi:integrase